MRSTLPWPFAAVEFEAIFDHLVALALDETGSDVVVWPGAAREDALVQEARPTRCFETLEFSPSCDAAQQVAA